MNFSSKIIKWYLANKRNLPWRVTDDPYKIWLSEIVLQQTRIDQGISYYLKLVASYPNVSSLASAKEQDILKLWQGLGYYSRARNLHKAAQIIEQKFKGNFPANYKDIIELPGIGEYTAAAISSMAFQKAYPVIDGNVIRVLSRIFGIELEISSIAAKKEMTKIAHELLLPSDPGTYNQAVMEFGALFCKPQNPDCASCIFSEDCFAFLNHKVDKLPFKNKPAKQKKRYFHYLIFKVKTESSVLTFLNKRTQKGIWQNLYDFPMIEKEKRLSIFSIENELKQNFNLGFVDKLEVSKEYKHILSHQLIYARFYVAEVDKVGFINEIQSKYQGVFLPIPVENFRTYPVPRLIEKVINETKIL